MRLADAGHTGQLWRLPSAEGSSLAGARLNSRKRRKRAPAAHVALILDKLLRDANLKRGSAVNTGGARPQQLIQAE